MKLLWLLFVSFVSYEVCLSEASESEGGTGANRTIKHYAVAALDWSHVEGPFMVTIWLLLASLFKIGFRYNDRFADIFPDSSMLILLGLVVGIILHFADVKVDYTLESEIFFLFLLPPIVFDAGFFMPNRHFFDNLGTILVYAVFGTLWNTFTIGFSLWGIGQTGIWSSYADTPLLHILLFTSLISAVDPVAVLSIFEEIHVNEILYITVFGESLLNDAVTVVLYKMFDSFSSIGEDNITAVDIILGLVSFFVIAIGGLLIGVIYAFIVSFITRFTTKVRVLEPLFVFTFAYASYLTAEMFHLSSILAIVFYGIVMRQYVSGNISQKSHTTVKYFLKMLSSSCETVIFMFLGLSTINSGFADGFNAAFVLLTVLFCLIYRAIGTIILTYFVNKKRLLKLDKVEQFIMAYGGLRGAIAYGLVVALNSDVVPGKKMFTVATIVVIYFTVFFQGITIKPLVNLLNIKRADDREKKMNEQIFERFSDHVLSGMEDLLGHYGHHWMRHKYEHWNANFIRKILMNKSEDNGESNIVEAFTKLNLKEAMNHLAVYGSVHQNAITSELNRINTENSEKIQTSDNAITMERKKTDGGLNPANLFQDLVFDTMFKANVKALVQDDDAELNITGRQRHSSVYSFGGSLANASLKRIAAEKFRQRAANARLLDMRMSISSTNDPNTNTTPTSKRVSFDDNRKSSVASYLTAADGPEEGQEFVTFTVPNMDDLESHRRLSSTLSDGGRVTGGRQIPGYFPMKQKVIRSHATQTGDSLLNLSNIDANTEFHSGLPPSKRSTERKTSDPTYERRPKSSDQISIDLTNFAPIAEEPETPGSPQLQRTDEIPMDSAIGAKEILLSFLDVQRKANGTTQPPDNHNESDTDSTAQC